MDTSDSNKLQSKTASDTSTVSDSSNCGNHRQHKLFRFMDLPAEIRNMIYKELHRYYTEETDYKDHKISRLEKNRQRNKLFPAIMRVSKQVREEVMAERTAPLRLIIPVRFSRLPFSASSEATTDYALFRRGLGHHQLDKTATRGYTDFSIYESVLDNVNTLNIVIESKFECRPIYVTVKFSQSISTTIGYDVFEEHSLSEKWEAIRRRLDDTLMAKIGKWNSTSSGPLRLSSDLLHEVITQIKESSVDMFDMDDEICSSSVDNK